MVRVGGTENKLVSITFDKQLDTAIKAYRANCSALKAKAAEAAKTAETIRELKEMVERRDRERGYR